MTPDERLAMYGFHPDEIAYARVTLRIVERDRWRDQQVPQTEVEAALLGWLRAGRTPELPFFVAANPIRQLLLF